MPPFVGRGSAASLLPINAEPNVTLMNRLPFGSISAAAVGGPKVREPRTGVNFQHEFCYHEGQHSCPIITGVGVRQKQLAGIKTLDVYAMALYVAGDAARRELHGRFPGTSLDSLAANQTLFDELVKRDSIEKTLTIVITSGLVKRNSFLHALNERLKPALDAAREPGMLAAFQRQFDGANFRKGLEIDFTWTPSGELVTKVDGQTAGTLRSKALAHTLLDLYVGRDPVSKKAKESFGKGLAAMVL